MDRLLEKSEVSGTCWVEFNVSGSGGTYEHWHASSRYASLGAMYEVYDLFAVCIKGFDLYRPIFIDAQNAKKLIGMLDEFASSSSNSSTGKFAAALSFFLRDSSSEKNGLWVLGV